MDFNALPQAENHRRVGFDKATVTAQHGDGANLLVVTGDAKRCAKQCGLA